MIVFIMAKRKAWHRKKLATMTKKYKCVIEGDLKASVVLLHRVMKEQAKKGIPSENLPENIYISKMRAYSFSVMPINADRERIEKSARIVFGIHLQ